MKGMWRKSLKTVTDSIKDVRKLHKEDRLHSRIVWRLWYMSIMIIFSAVIVIYDMIRGNESIGLLISLMFMGGLIGLIMIRIYKFDWDAKKELVVAKKYDAQSFLVLAAYIVSRIYMEVSFEEVYNHHIIKAIAASLSVLIGLASVRLIGLAIAVSKTFKNRKK